MNYFEVIPIEIIQIIVSFLDEMVLVIFIQELERLGLKNGLNWFNIHSHHFGVDPKYHQICMIGYIKYLKSEELIKRMLLKLGMMKKHI